MENEYYKYIIINLGKNIKLTRIKVGLSQKELAIKADLCRETISSIERAKYIPQINTVNAIADALGIELYKLFIFD